VSSTLQFAGAGPSSTEPAATTLSAALDIWVSGGWAMIAIAAVALLLFGLGVNVWIRLWSTGFQSVPERVWRRWIDAPDEREGNVGALLDHVAAAQRFDEVPGLFAQVRTLELAPFARDLKVMKVCVSAAPLFGLLGTVVGMLATFGALASGGGGDQTMELVAAGISEALITTETGLVVALPGLFFQYQLGRKFDHYRAFLAHLESVLTQTLFRRAQAQSNAT